MAPRRAIKDGGRRISKDEPEPISETASSAMGDDAIALRKKRGRPRKPFAAGTTAAAALGDRPGGDAECDNAASSAEEEEDDDDDEDEEEEEKVAAPAVAAGAIARAAGFSVGGPVEQAMMKKGTRRAPLQQISKDGMDLQSELLMMRCLHGRGSHRRKGKPTRAAQASF